MDKLLVRYLRPVPREEYKIKDFDIGDGFDVRVFDVSVKTPYGRIELAWHEGLLDGSTPVEYMKISKGTRLRAHLGFAMRLPDGFKANLKPRSSTPDKIECIQANSVGLIDQTYCGNSDEWMQEFYAQEDTYLIRYERIGQFTVEQVHKFSLVEVDDLKGTNRGGFGEGTKDIK